MNSYQNNTLDVKHLTKSYGTLKVVDNFNMQLNKNEFVTLVGQSGCGKSTIFNMIAGLLTPDSGIIEIAGKNVINKTGQISYMYQKDLLLPWRKVIDNVSLPFVINGFSKKEAREKVAGYFKIFGLEGFEYNYPNELSGGMKQRAALMRTYMNFKDIILLDEPFGGLDAITKLKMQEWLLEVTSNMKASVLFITHDIEEAIFLSDRIYILSDRPAHVKKEIFVNLSRPRNTEIKISENFNNIKREVFNLL